MTNKKNKITPMMEQYFALKKENPNGLLFYRMGDFYELFYDDAIVASSILKITLTKRNSNIDIPMAGIPYHAADSYISKLVSNGYTVVICEQMEEAQAGKIVKRAVDRIITPSTASEDTIVEPTEEILLASLYYSYGNYGLAEFNMSNGMFVFNIFEDDDELYYKLKNTKYSEIILPESLVHREFLKNKKGVKNLDDSFFSYIENESILKSLNLVGDKYLRKNKYKSSIVSCGAIVNYIRSLQQNFFPYAKSICDIKDFNFVSIDNVTIKNLELLNNENGYSSTLFSTLNYSLTSMGSRKLKEWIVRPINSPDILEKRLNVVGNIINNNSFFNEINSFLIDIPDIERILTRISQKNVKPRDLFLLKNALNKIPHFINIIDNNNCLSHYKSLIPDVSSLTSLLNNSIVDEPPNLIKDGDVIKDGFDKELDELRNITGDITDAIFKIEKNEKDNNGIDKIKIIYNKILGFYIPITKSKINSIPKHFILKQSLKNENRYTIIELKNIEEKMITANSKALTKEKMLYNEIINTSYNFIFELNILADLIAEIDVLNSFSIVSKKQNYVKPIIFSKQTKIIDGRHAVLEGQRDFHFTPNDFDLKNKKLIMLTGPNMGGKSTYMRQNAIIYIMAYIGCFVPAKYAEIKEVDKIFTRIGAGDNLSEGLSTFMVEMKEGANILKNATSKSFVLIDEIGRGTSTYDGLSIAWAFAEKLSNTCDTIFSTHYFELTEFENLNKNIVNMYMKSTSYKNEIIFLHKVDYGYVDESYGLVVAKNAGVDQDVIASAQKKLDELKR